MEDKVRKIGWKWWLIPLIIILGLIIVYVWVTGPTERINKDIPLGFLYQKSSEKIPEEFIVERTPFLTGRKEPISVAENPELQEYGSFWSDGKGNIFVGGREYDTSIIYQRESTFYCKTTNQEAQKIEYYSYSPGWGVMGGWSFRYAILCEENYFVVDGSDDTGTGMYGPFKI